jgi:ATP phosphoribosyltransferase
MVAIPVSGRVEQESHKALLRCESVCEQTEREMRVLDADRTIASNTYVRDSRVI